MKLRSVNRVQSSWLPRDDILINQKTQSFMMPLILALMLECQVLHRYKCFQPKRMERKEKQYSKIKEKRNKTQKPCKSPKGRPTAHAPWRVKPGRLYVGRWNERVRARRCDAVDWGLLKQGDSTYLHSNLDFERNYTKLPSMWISNFFTAFLFCGNGKR